jgi:hypothetical protein
MVARVEFLEASLADEEHETRHGAHRRTHLLRRGRRR